MLDIKFIRENPQVVKEGCKKKQVKVNIDQLLKLDEKRRNLIEEQEKLKAEKNKISRQRSELNKAKRLKEKIKSLENQLKGVEKDFNNLMLQVPNLPLDNVPVGKDESENIIIKEVGKKTKFDLPNGRQDFKPKNYLEIAEKLDLIDVKRSAKVSGTRFGYLREEAALLELALINLAFDNLVKEGFIPIIPPVMIRPEMLEKTGHLSEKDRPERYFIEKDNLYLAGTAEQSIGAMHADEVFEEKELPKRYVGFSTCFRREAGAYGRDTKGIFRVHQFDKIEMFSFCQPEKSKEEHKFLLSLEEELMQLLKIPYQIVQICTGDLGMPTAAKYDIEAWLPSENRYRETHSTSSCTDFQARRLNIRYRNSKTKKLEFVHTLNGTAFAIGRTLIAIIENYQQKDGSIKIPQILQKYIGKSKISK